MSAQAYRLLIIADDLTGSVDAGVHFAEKGINTTVIPDFSSEAGKDRLDKSLQVMVINTESRHIPAHEAAKRVSSAVRKGLSAGMNIIYKKTDSTLRGNIGAELEALSSTAGVKKLAFIPAYPLLKRYTREGLQYVANKLLHHTHFANDPLEPIKTSYIPDLLQEQTSSRLLVVSKPYDRYTGFSGNEDKEILIFDCTTDKDLYRIGDFLKRNNLFNVIAGSAGIARVIADQLSSPASKPEKINFSGPILILNGSLNPVSLNQVAYLAKDTSLKSILLDPEIFNDREKGVCEEICQEVINTAESGRDILIGSASSREGLYHYLNKIYGDQISGEVFSKAASFLGRLLACVLKEAHFGALIIIGGDTLMAMVRQMHINAISPLKEVLPGVALSKILISNRPLLLVTRPGGYGKQDNLKKIITYLNSIRV
ncbi:MAG: hypothetical protein AMS27_12530 [Bacteroides sp. SM23_62_1]|nr:MAG: hypothetical protein AMS27_12530 [Bacteroides sp. SM23_62_1]